jgi:hypothetical protein
MIIANSNGADVNIENLNGLLIIDCWDWHVPHLWLNRNKHKINFDQFDSIVIANYELMLDGSDIIQRNLLGVYAKQNFVPKMLLPVLQFAGHRKTHPWLQSNLNDRSFLILTPESMQHHVESMVPHVTNWLVVGGGWNMCTHLRPLGFYSLKAMPYNFYITDWSMIGRQVAQPPGSIEHIEHDKLTWIEHNKLFQLKRDNHP